MVSSISQYIPGLTLRGNQLVVHIKVKQVAKDTKEIVSGHAKIGIVAS